MGVDIGSVGGRWRVCQGGVVLVAFFPLKGMISVRLDDMKNILLPGMGSQEDNVKR